MTTRWIRILGALAAVALLAGLVMGFGVAPREVNQGNVQRIMYLHVPAVLTAYLAFAIVLVASIAHLVTRSLAWDRWAAGAAEIGTIFTGVTLVSGSIWGKPTWGVWWTWDARLTLTALMFFLYLGYLALRRVPADTDVRARRSAVTALLSLAVVPVNHFAVEWWRTLHQDRSLAQLTPRDSLDGEYITVMLLGFFAMTLVYAWLVALRYRVEQVEERDDTEGLAQAIAERRAEAVTSP